MQYLFLIIRLLAFVALYSPLASAQQTLTNAVPYFKPILPSVPEVDKWTGSIGGGFSLSRGNTQSSQLTLKTDLTRIRDFDQILLRSLIVRAKNQGVETANSIIVAGRYERNFNTDYFALLAVDLERDTFKDLSSRYSLGPGIGYRAIRSDNAQLDIFTGVAYSVSHYLVAEDTREVENFLGNEWSYKLSDAATIRQRWLLYPKINAREGSRSLLEISVTSKLISGLGMQMSLIHKYRGQVNNNEKQTDVLFFTGLTAKF